MENSMEGILQQLENQIDFDKLEELCAHLEEDIRDILDSCGLYYRIFSRVKSINSIAKKLYNGKYGTQKNPKKIQDLFGLRIVLYYSDDLSICRKIMEKAFRRIGDWSKNDFNAVEFRATKINGVFRFPSEYFKSYTRELWELPIDTTFEMQFRTVFFEGWHEIEHDMRYKSLLPDDKFWENSEDLSRILNCILANLELSDWSLVQLFEQLSYNHYKNGNWELMLKSHFRLKMNDKEKLAPEILSLFDQNRNLAKKFFKCKRSVLIRELLKQDFIPDINFNLIIKLLNDSTVQDPQIHDFFQQHDPLSKRNSVSPQKPLTALRSNTLFQLQTPLLHRTSRNIKSEFNNVSHIIYRWARHKMNLVFPELPSEVTDIKLQKPGYYLKFCWEPEQLSFQLALSYIDNTLPGALWDIHAAVYPTATNQLMLQHKTTLHAPATAIQRESFSKPSYLTELSSKVGLVDQERLGSQGRFLHSPEALQQFEALLQSPERHLPVVLITQYSNVTASTSSEYREGYDMNTFPINGTRLAKVIGLYAHVYMMDRCLSNEWATHQNLPPEDTNGSIMIFWPSSSQRDTTLFTHKIIQETQFDFNRFAFQEQNFHEKAFRRKLAQIIKDDNISH